MLRESKVMFADGTEEWIEATDIVHAKMIARIRWQRAIVVRIVGGAPLVAMAEKGGSRSTGLEYDNDAESSEEEEEEESDLEDEADDDDEETDTDDEEDTGDEEDDDEDEEGDDADLQEDEK